MSAAVGTNLKETAPCTTNVENDDELNKNSSSRPSTAAAEEEEDFNAYDDGGDEEEDSEQLKETDDKELDLGPQLSLKEQLEKDKDDESLRKWKEQLLGTLDMPAVGESKEPEVKILSMSIICPGRPDLVLQLPFQKAVGSKKSSLFALKEGSPYHLKLSFIVSNNIASGLTYTNTVWKTGVKVDHTKVMVGTYSPQKEAYTFELEEETTPSGIFARGSYSARTKIVDDDGKCYLDASYHFEIQKKWPSRS